MVNPTNINSQLNAARATSVANTNAKKTPEATLTLQTTMASLRAAAGNLLTNSRPRTPIHFTTSSASASIPSATKEVELTTFPPTQAQSSSAAAGLTLSMPQTSTDSTASAGPLATHAAAILSQAPRDSDPQAAAVTEAVSSASEASEDHPVTAPAGNFLTRFFANCFAKLARTAGRTDYAETSLTMADLLNKQSATSLKISKFLFGRVGYALCSYFTSWTSDTTKALITRIQTLESAAKDAPKLQAAAERVAKAITNGNVHTDAIISEQETLVPASLNRGGKKANAELQTSLAELHKLARDFVHRYRPVTKDQDDNDGNPYEEYKAYATVLMNLIKNSPTGKYVSDADMNTLLNRNLLSDTIISLEVENFVSEVKRSLVTKGARLPDFGIRATKLARVLSIEGTDPMFINNLTLKKLGSSNITSLLKEFVERESELSPELKEVDSKEQDIRATIKGFAQELNRLIEARATARIAYLRAFVEDIQLNDDEAKVSGQHGLNKDQRKLLVRCKDANFDMETSQALMASLATATVAAPKTIEEALTLLEGKTKVASFARHGIAQSVEAIASYTLRQDAQQAFQRAAQNLAENCMDIFGASTEEDLPKLEEIKALIQKDAQGNVTGFLTRTHGDQEAGGLDEKVIAFEQGQLHDQVEKLMNIPDERTNVWSALALKKQQADDLLVVIEDFNLVLARAKAKAAVGYTAPNVFDRALMSVQVPKDVGARFFAPYAAVPAEGAFATLPPSPEDARNQFSTSMATLNAVPEEASEEATASAVVAAPMEAAPAPKAPATLAQMMAVLDAQNLEFSKKYHLEIKRRVL